MPPTLLNRPTFNIPNFSYKEYDSNVPVKGNGNGLGLTDGTSWIGMNTGNNDTKMVHNYSPINPVGRNMTSEIYTASGNKLVGLITDPTKSGIIGTLSQTKSCNMIIKY